MKMTEMDFTDFPSSYGFAQLVDRQNYLWLSYAPTTIEADMPFGTDWWKFVYWMPFIKKDFYLMAIQALNFEKGLDDKIKQYDMDYWFFTTYYKEFIDRLIWMRKQGSNVMGEIK